MRLLFIAIVFSSFLYGCKKEPSDTPSDLIINKWFIINNTTQYFNNDTLSNTFTRQPNEGDFVEFNKDGTLLTVEIGGPSVLSKYKV